MLKIHVIVSANFGGSFKKKNCTDELNETTGLNLNPPLICPVLLRKTKHSTSTNKFQTKHIKEILSEQSTVAIIDCLTTFCGL